MCVRVRTNLVCVRTYFVCLRAFSVCMCVTKSACRSGHFTTKMHLTNVCSFFEEKGSRSSLREIFFKNQEIIFLTSYLLSI